MVVVQLFIWNWSGHLGRAVEQEDIVTFRRDVLRFKGDAGLMGLSSIVRLCDEILKLSSRGPRSEVLGALDRLRREFDRIKHVVGSWRAATAASHGDQE